MAYRKRKTRNTGGLRIVKDVTPAPAVRGFDSVSLTCGCTRNDPGGSKVGDEIYCIYHEKAVFVCSVLPAYSIKCRKCNYGDNYGQSRVSAYTYASKHSIRRPGHIVDIRQGEKTLDSTGKEKQLTLTDKPPF